MTNTLDGKIVLVTGANGGIGNAICEELLKNNANLVLMYNKSSESITKLKENYGDKRIDTHKVDLLDAENLDKKLSEIIQSRKVIDCFIHSVSLPFDNKLAMDMDWSEIQTHIDIQSRSFFQIVKSVFPGMKEKKKGRIISILSTSSIGKPPARMTSYVTGKHALLGLSKTLSVELGSYGITVNCISPSLVDTNLTGNFPQKFKEISVSQTPTKKMTKPEEVAALASYLCTDSTDSISGENIIVSGAQTLH